MWGAGGIWWAHTPALLWLSHCLQCQQRLGRTLRFALLLFLLTERGCSQPGQSTVQMEGKEERKNRLGFLSVAPQERLLNKPHQSTEDLDILICKMGSRG